MQQSRTDTVIVRYGAQDGPPPGVGEFEERAAMAENAYLGRAATRDLTRENKSTRVGSTMCFHENGLPDPTLDIPQAILNILSTSSTYAQACGVRRCSRLRNNVRFHAFGPPSRTTEPYFSSTRFIIFDKHAEIIALHQLEFPQYYPHPGFVVSLL